MDCQAEREPWVDDSRISRLKGIGMIELADELVSIRKMAKEMVNECFCRTERVAEIAYASATVKQASQPREKAGKKKDEQGKLSEKADSESDSDEEYSTAVSAESEESSDEEYPKQAKKFRSAYVGKQGVSGLGTKAPDNVLDKLLGSSHSNEEQTQLDKVGGEESAHEGHDFPIREGNGENTLGLDMAVVDAG